MDVLMATDVVIIEECKQCEQSLTIKKKTKQKTGRRRECNEGELHGH